ncbi:hypothetical protein [Streptomyces xanthochromogenes]|uniref:hypothetical protein n=1 Tax=Streptomyces xanthochromogenes TaxID=67384 RepID=UPI00341ABE04
MAIRHGRKALIAGFTGVVVTLAGITTLAVAQAVPKPAAPAAAPQAVAGEMPSAVEDFNYPGAAKILAEQGITLKRGDGHIMLSDCTAAWDIKVKARTDTSSIAFCFTVSGSNGYLALEMPKAFGMWTKDHPVQATLIALDDGEKQVVNAPAGTPSVPLPYTNIGESSATGKISTLVEFRVTK